MNLALFDMGGAWHQVKRCDVRARLIVDRHYSRRTVGAQEFLTVGKTLVLLTADESAVWACIEHKDPRGKWVWRNTVFRNEGSTLSSDLVREATARTVSYWARRYELPTKYWLRTEINTEKTRHKRDPGRCYRKAGWHPLGFVNGLFHLEAPRFDFHHGPT